MKTMFPLSISLFCCLLNSCDKGVGPEPYCAARDLDTTTHAFSWTITEVGDGAGSILYDVAIVNDTLAYGVGEINAKDSLGNWINPPYNLARWDGNQWELSTVFYNYQGIDSYGTIRSVFAFSPDDIWFGIGNLIHWNGQQFTSIQLPQDVWGPYRINKIWGNGRQLYIVSDGGSIARFNGSSWQKLESGTMLPIRDIWGATDPRTGQETILAIASGSSPEEGSALLSIDGTTVTHLSTEGLSWSLSGIWFAPYCNYYIVGAGIHQKSSLMDPSWSVYPSGEVTSYASGGIRGSGLNNVFVAGSFYEVVHFNGSTWYNYRNEIPMSGGALGGMAVRDNLVITVGLNGQKAVAVIGRR